METAPDILFIICFHYFRLLCNNRSGPTTCHTRSVRHHKKCFLQTFQQRRNVEEMCAASRRDCFEGDIVVQNRLLSRSRQVYMSTTCCFPGRDKLYLLPRTCCFPGPDTYNCCPEVVGFLNLRQCCSCEDEYSQTHTDLVSPF